MTSARWSIGPAPRVPIAGPCSQRAEQIDALLASSTEICTLGTPADDPAKSRVPPPSSNPRLLQRPTSSSRIRTRHVPGPLVTQHDDVAATRALLEDVMPTVCAIVGVSDEVQAKITSLLRSDAQYVENVIAGPGRTRPVMTVHRLAKHAALSRPSLYRDLPALSRASEELAIALVLVLAARGDYCDATVWQVCELDTQVGRDASGPGIVGGRQRLFGIALAGGDVVVPAILQTPVADMLEVDFVSELDTMLESVATVISKTRQFARSSNGQLLARVGITPSTIDRYAPESTLLGTELHLGRRAPAGWESPTRVTGSAIAKVAFNHGFRHVVYQTDRSLDDELEWMLIRAPALREIAGRVAVSGFDLAIRPSRVSYLTHTGHAGVGALQRRQLFATPDDRGFALAGSLGFHAAGFSLDRADELAKAVTYAEFLATNEHSGSMLDRFSRQLTPALVKAQNPESRALIRALRMLFNAALVSVVRQRQARQLGG